MTESWTDLDVRLRHVEPEDALALYRLVRDVGTLEPNSAYCYALCADHFRDTTVVAERGGSLVGVVVAYRPPTRPEALFVWQVGVTASMRRTGLGARLLDAALSSTGARGARFLLATVTPTNVASRRLFERFARAHGAPLHESRGYDGAHLPADHAPERLLSIGPLATSSPEELP